MCREEVAGLCPHPVVPRVAQQAQPWVSLGTWELLKACDDRSAPGAWPAARDRQSQQDSSCRTGTGCGGSCPCPHCPTAQSGAASQHFAPCSQQDGPFLGVCVGLGCCPAGPAVGQRLCNGAWWQEGPCSTSPGTGSLWLFPPLARAQGWPGHGWYGDNLTLAKAAPKPHSQPMDATNLGHCGGLLPTLSYQEPGAAHGELSPLHGVASAPVRSWVHPAGGRCRMQGLSGGAASASRQAAGARAPL
ncbi:uncharacterized protein LOC133270965 [Pezoporus flaviventris]|uniref:uncharacterized protein LOC133270965 n=1 Tax=Pezoporus flaviventris TaxID=889875 RepID=UPI002AAF466D|nr:uncharacterized protein LOC133270965 [Pezoporus flaviventris]